jgi:hypothetical protein
MLFLYDSGGRWQPICWEQEGGSIGDAPSSVWLPPLVSLTRSICVKSGRDIDLQVIHVLEHNGTCVPCSPVLQYSFGKEVSPIGWG